MYSSIWTTSAAGSRNSRTSLEPKSRRTRSNAVAKLTASSARITPRLADSTVGFTTTGNDKRSSSDIASVAAGTVTNEGVGSPAALSFWRMRRLSRDAAAASGGLPGSPRSRET
jgi:hypothetical protein